MVITILITVLAINPPTNKIVIYHNLTLTCILNRFGEDKKTDYQWHRVGSQIPAKAMVVNDKLTIPSIVPEDQGQYYCTGRQFQWHCAESNHVTVKTDGEKIMALKNKIFTMKTSYGFYITRYLCA